MKKEALGLNDMAIPGVPYANRMGTKDEDLAISNRFFGQEDRDNMNQNSQPVITKRFEHQEDTVYVPDPHADKYFNFLLKMRTKKKSARNQKDSQKV